MNRPDYSEIITRIIINKSVVKSINLALAVMEEVNPVIFSFELYNFALNRLIELHELEKIEFVIPNTDYRIQSVYFPKGTTFK